MRVTIRPATVADVPFIVATERGPDYEWVVGRWEAEQHLAALADPSAFYFIGEREGEPFGFALFLDRDHPEGLTLLKRIAVKEPGSGFGRPFLTGVLHEAFAWPGTRHVWLTVAPHNARARHLYESLGFVTDGVSEGHVDPRGRPFMSLRMVLHAVP